MKQFSGRPVLEFERIHISDKRYWYAISDFNKSDISRIGSNRIAKKSDCDTHNTINDTRGYDTHLVPRDEGHEDIEQASGRPVLEEAEVLGEPVPLQLGEHDEHTEQDAVDAKQDAAGWWQRKEGRASDQASETEGDIESHQSSHQASLY